MRVLALWCPDWPVSASGHDPDQPVAVVEAGMVRAASAAARQDGVRIGMRRREATGCSPDLLVLAGDRAQEARLFEPVAAAVAALTPLVEVVRPGLLVFDALGPARYFGGEASLHQHVTAAATRALPSPSCPAPMVGIADGRFAAVLAARQGAIVPIRSSAGFVAPLPVSVLGRPDLADLLGRLGIHTLGAFAALPAAAVVARFGAEAGALHALASGKDHRSLQATTPAEELAASIELDPPAKQAETAAFAGRSLATDLIDQLRQHGLTCTLVRIEAETTTGAALCRRWRGDGGSRTGPDRHDGNGLVPDMGLGVDMLVERLRWQLDGWLSGTTTEPPPTGGLTRLRLVAEEVVPATGHQLGLWGAISDTDRRAARGLDRLRGMLGPQAVVTATIIGGRGPAERVTLVPWGELPPSGDPASLPWPGHYPSPAPELVHRPPIPAEVVDAEGMLVTVSARGGLSAPPALLSIGPGPQMIVVAWAGPWTADERWWDPAARRRRARLQLLTGNTSNTIDPRNTGDGTAHLCAVEAGRWWVEATYG